MKAIGINVIVRPITETQTKGGLLVVNREDDSNILRGEVLSVGDGHQLGKTRKMNVKEGQIVGFPRVRGVKEKKDGEEIRILTIDEIFYIDETI